MLEQENIQSRGFRNIYKGGKAIGFQFRFRSSYYRGLFLSMLRPLEVRVDGETFKGDQIKFSVGGKTYEQKDFQNYPDVYWQIYEPCILTINKPGGLSLGIHEVECGYAYTQCYEFAPPDAILLLSFTTRKMTLAR